LRKPSVIAHSAVLARVRKRHSLRYRSLTFKTDVMGNRERSEHLQEAIRRIDAENAQDPRSITWEGGDIPCELFYSQQRSQWVQRLFPGASEALLIASRAQHICRWQIPRGDYPAKRRPGAVNIAIL
jgi:hypothetical protein